jgi:hypothetical protein
MSSSQMWVAYDSVSGDVLADGSERRIRKYLASVEEATGGRHTVCIASGAEWRRAAKVIARRMSGNPPRRMPPGIEHL